MHTSDQPANNNSNTSLNKNNKSTFKKQKNNSLINNMCNQNILNNSFEDKINECTNTEYKKSYTEIVDKELTDYLFNLNNDALKGLIYDDADNVNENGEKYNSSTYVKYVKKILKKYIQNNYSLNVNYRQNDNVGRRFTLDGGIQNLQNRLKSSLVDNICYDYDMVNAHPSIVLYIIKNYFKNLPCNYIAQYVNDRKNVLVNNNIDKFDILKSINVSHKLKSDNPWLLSFHQEITNLQNILYEKLKDKFVINSKTNPKGSLLNKVLCVLENHILHTAESHIYEKYNIYPDSLMFDGLHYKINNIIDDLNSCTKIYGINWDIKKHSLKIEIGESPILPQIKYEDSYLGVKEKFEKTYFLLLSPKVLFCRLYNDNDGLVKMMSYKTKADFTTVTSPITFKVMGKDGPTDIDFVTYWLKDKDRKIFERAVFKPQPMICYENEFNKFTGFCFERWDNTIVDMNPDNYIIYQEHIKYLVGNDKQLELFNFMEQYIANILFNPGKLPKVALILRSESKQIGKNLFFGKFFENTLYKTAILDTTKPEQIFGKFTSGDNKFVVTINESTIKSNYELMENIKSAITDPNQSVEKKGVDTEVYDNLARYIFFSNNLNCVKIEQGDMRFIACNNIEKKKSRDYYNKLSHALDDKKRLLSYINYLKTIFNPNYDFADNRPLTNYYNDLQAITIPVIVDFWIYVINKNPKDSINIRANELYKLYNKWAKNRKLESVSNQKFGRMIKDYDFLLKKRDTRGSFYIIDTHKLSSNYHKQGFITNEEEEDLLNIISNQCLIDDDEL